MLIFHERVLLLFFSSMLDDLVPTAFCYLASASVHVTDGYFWKMHMGHHDLCTDTGTPETAALILQQGFLQSICIS